MVGRAADLPVISPETVTDYIHAVIEADRTFYTIHVVERMQKQGGSPAAENWRGEKDLAVASSVPRGSERPGIEDWNEGPLPVDQSVADQSAQCLGRGA